MNRESVQEAFTHYTYHLYLIEVLGEKYIEFIDNLEDDEARFLEWCIVGVHHTTDRWPTHEVFWAYFHAARVHANGGPRY